MRKFLALVLIAALGAVLIAAVVNLPEPGTTDSPVHTHVSAGYIKGGHEAGGADNLVTAVLLNYRAIDTFGEVTVIFTALIAVLAATSLAGPTERSGTQNIDLKTTRVPVSPVVSFVVRLMAPFIATFALFVMLKGHELPGGGFQGGVVLGAMLILLALFSGRTDKTDDEELPPGLRNWIRAAGPLVFGALGLTGLVFSGWLFSLPDHPFWREMVMIGLELGIGIGGAAVLVGLFRALREG
ncbi:MULTISPECIES: hydrogen gas-evolving membrane-bound hydrogenase subunit E [unclassified Wenzhouxiangella]|uniref:hydrogen gas-evolving membrane-bound hydrogenase subunit E n=1 Tax=unclassified Wenzhouxiangella TaxID=2613841 RepID=UPI000E329864|nr:MULTISPECIES: hydrogen gas-evolving membrane-bound hydrogenase subunit E [unclassified Wenzhouxiangella]RFF28030.1 sodium:proton antiporter [Wenzhouxiangella sp. 15181]RFP68616.1 sodium:proton antiporter [Wenzhouxiangella sp. 15190]